MELAQLRGIPSAPTSHLLPPTGAKQIKETKNTRRISRFTTYTHNPAPCPHLLHCKPRARASSKKTYPKMAETRVEREIGPGKDGWYQAFEGPDSMTPEKEG
jgi:hypothetical protein